MDVSFCTTEQLITELVHRKTFLGVVIRSEKEFREAKWSGERIFRITNSNMTRDEMLHLLRKIVDFIESRNPSGGT
jgi:hypothetical protein